MHIAQCGVSSVIIAIFNKSHTNLKPEYPEVWFLSSAVTTCVRKKKKDSEKEKKLKKWKKRSATGDCALLGREALSPKMDSVFCFLFFWVFCIILWGQLPVFMLIGWRTANNHFVCSWAKYSWADGTWCKWQRTKCGRALAYVSFFTTCTMSSAQLRTSPTSNQSDYWRCANQSA